MRSAPYALGSYNSCRKNKMKKPFAFCLVLVLILGISVSGCNSNSMEGYYHGTDPDVSFEIYKDANGNYIIDDFWVTGRRLVHKGVSYPYIKGIVNSIPVEPDGSFILDEIAGHIEGKINGQVVTGHTSFDFDILETTVNGLYAHFILDKSAHDEFDWIATRAVTTPTPTPIPTLMPPKLGHFTGTDVSFDVTAAGIENFTLKGGCVTPIGPGQELTLSLSQIDINADGSLLVWKDFKGWISGDFAKGDWKHLSCTYGDYTYYTNSYTDWAARWVSP
jgi:hypothetical protein